jgi:hypothetical protein
MPHSVQERNERPGRAPPFIINQRIDQPEHPELSQLDRPRIKENHLAVEGKKSEQSGKTGPRTGSARCRSAGYRIRMPRP